ncbi:PREDICTED: uncharacterized protein LOC108560906 [Nicrophorus vespilloides]|uniref:Uncharacterized protein LOC108560906 n=1 Tax=Nicrophorus vespilloides TaxID=110193 RepID=A0ABM1MHR6_NICVS|nr:PREDICTED: uncharacterized protein LOC108560906 [Nicrophorus vespilloides]
MAPKTIEILSTVEDYTECDLFVVTGDKISYIINYRDVVSDTRKIQLEKKLLFRSKNGDVLEGTLIFISTLHKDFYKPDIQDVYEYDKIQLSDEEMMEVEVKYIEEDTKVEDTNSLKRKRKVQKDKDEFVSFGLNKSLINKSIYKTINWSCYKIATRELLMALFSKVTLGTHGFKKQLFRKEKHLEKYLDSRIIEDIIHLVCEKCEKVRSSSVRAVISSKCSEENKIWKKLQNQLKKRTRK